MNSESRRIWTYPVSGHASAAELQKVLTWGLSPLPNEQEIPIADQGTKPHTWPRTQREQSDLMVNGQKSLPRLGQAMRKRGDHEEVRSCCGSPQDGAGAAPDPALEPLLTLLVRFQEHFNRVKSTSYNPTQRY